MDATDEKIKRVKGKARKWALLLLAVAAALWGLYTLLHRYTDWSFLMAEPVEIRYTFRCSGRDIQRFDGTGWTDFTLRGVELDSNQNHADYAAYLRWLTAISEMNANAVRVHELMPPDFYRALSDLNAGGTILYLVQGVELSQETFAQMEDLESGDMVGLFKKKGRLTMDAVHGNRKALGYTTDVSPHTMAYIIGDTWDPDLVAYTDHAAADIAGRFSGRYAAAWEVADASTTLLSRVFDDLFSYETRKYGEQHIMGLGNTQPTDMLFHDVSWATGLNENLAHINTAHISPTGRVKTGVFAALRVNTGTMQNLSFDPAYTEYTDPDGRRNAVRYYLDALYSAHRIPVLLGGTSMSAARGCSGIDELFGYDRGGVGEELQGEGLCFVYSQAVDAGFCGGFAGYYLDNPENTAWNTALFSRHSASWLDAQDSEQSLGLAALEPGASPVCILDGNGEEWAGRPAILRRDGVLLQAAGDEKYLYLHLSIEGYNPQMDVLYLPMDVTPLSGASKNSSQELTFDRDMDFLLTVNGKKRAKLTVQAYYEAMDSLNSQELDYDYWFVAPPARDSDEFVDVLQYVRPALFPADGSTVDPVMRDTGLLRYGCGDPESESYDGLSDYCIDGEDIEIRIPWALLNFVDPSRGQILGDFNRGGGGDSRVVTVDAMYIGLNAYRDGAMTDYASGAFALPCYETAVYRERFRPAYYALQKLFEAY